MANDIADLLLRIDASTEGLRRELAKAEEAVSNNSSEINKNTKKIDDSFEKMSDGVSKSLRLIGTALAAMGVSLSVRAVTEYADAWQNATNQLKTVQKDTESLTDTQNMLMAVANESRAEFETTANLYTRLARSTESLNLSQAELIGLTETINKSFAVSGASAQEATNAIIQLSQGLAAGALRGEEFNSVSEQSPILMQAIADSLNMTRGELRAFAAEGGITAEIVVKALQEASGEIENTFSKMMATPMQQMTVARNNLLKFFGSSELLQNSLRAAGGAIVAATEFLVSFGQETEQNAEFQRLFNQTLRDGQADLNDYSAVISQVLQVTNSLLEGKRELVRIQLAENAVITNNKELIEAANNLLGEGARQTARQAQLTEGLTMAETLRNSVLASANQLQSENNQATSESTARTAEQITELRKQAVALDHGRFSTQAQRQAIDDLMQSIIVIDTSYERWIPLLSETQWRMQGVTDAVKSNQKAVEFWTAVSEQGAERRKAAEEEATRTMRENWQRTHEYLTDTILNIANNGGNAFKQIADSFSAMIKRMIAEWAASGIMNLLGLGGGGSVANPIAAISQGAIGQAAKTVIGTLTGGGAAGAAGSIGGAVASAGSAISGAVAAVPGWGLALAGGAALAAALDKKPTLSGNAGLLIHDAPGAPSSQKFAVDPFASGFSPVGFARREDQGAANQVIDVFRQYDAALTDIATKSGLKVDFGNNPFGGYDENAKNNGLFLGAASEAGKPVGTPLDQQLNKFVGQWIDALGGQVSPEQRAAIKAAGSADAMIQKAAEIAGLHGSHASGLSYVPFDGYRAELHKGERILTADENKDMSMMSAMSGKMDALMMQVALYSRRMSQIIDDWDARGLPPERTA